MKTLEERQTIYRQILSIEPGNEEAMAGLAVVLTMLAAKGFTPELAAREKLHQEGRDWALKAKELDPRLPNIYAALANYASSHGDYEGARRASEIGLSLDPKHPMGYSNLATDYIAAGEPAKAIELLTSAIRLDPRQVRDHILANMGRAHFMVGDNMAAVEWLLKALDVNPGYADLYAYLAMSYARKGDHTRARAAVAALLRAEPNFSLSRLDTPEPGDPAAYREFWETKLLPAWRLAGLPE